MMFISNFLKSGDKVKHIFNNMQGIILQGEESKLTNPSGNVRFYEVRFYNFYTGEFKDMLCIAEELEKI